MPLGCFCLSANPDSTIICISSYSRSTHKATWISMRTTVVCAQCCVKKTVNILTKEMPIKCEVLSLSGEVIHTDWVSFLSPRSLLQPHCSIYFPCNHCALWNHFIPWHFFTGKKELGKGNQVKIDQLEETANRSLESISLSFQTCMENRNFI